MESRIGNIEITNPNKVLFKSGKITKFDIAKYYEEASGLMLPLIESRLLSVIRCHKGIEEECFFKKHPATDKNHVEVYNVSGEEYFYLKDKTQLIYQVQMGTVEFHNWGSKVPEIGKPDVMVFDLDPSDNLSLTKLRQGTKELGQVLNELGFETFLKTSGGKGYHIEVPTTKFDDWESINKFSKDVALYMENKYPRAFTSNIRKNAREGKIFIDYLRNAKGATCVAAYSVRARKNAPISFPISWDELNEIKPNEITINNYQSYLSKTNPWSKLYSIDELER